MITTNATNLRKDLFNVLNGVAKYSDPVTVNLKEGNVVLLNLEDYQNMMETLYLDAIPGMRESILKHKEIDESDFVSEDEVEW